VQGQKDKNLILLVLIIVVIIIGSEKMFSRWNFNVFESTQEEYLEFTVDALKNERLELDGFNGKIEATEYDGNTLNVKVQYQLKSSARENPQMELIHDNKKVHLAYDKKKYRGISIEAEIPKEAFDYVHLKTSNGKIEVEDITAKEIKVNTSNGKIEIKDSDADQMIAETSNGKIEVEDVDSPDIELHSSNASIVYECSDELFENDYQWNFETSNGSIHVQLPNTNAYGYKVDASTSNGEIGVYIPAFLSKTTKGTLEGTSKSYENAKVKIDLELDTSNGSITVE
jgi:DUF4097 and DUF4098 domain-containing protein YvlB